MSIKDYSKVCIITDSTTGDYIDCIKLNNYSKETICEMIKDLVYYDLVHNKNGIHFKYGIEP